MAGSHITQRPHENLVVWEEAMELVTQIYQLTKRFPPSEKYVLGNQMQKACISIPSNIAEGAARESDREFLRFLGIARGSLAELETQIQIACKLGYLSDIGDILRRCNSIFSKLSALMNSVRIKHNNASM